MGTKQEREELVPQRTNHGGQTTSQSLVATPEVRGKNSEYGTDMNDLDDSEAIDSVVSGKRHYIESQRGVRNSVVGPSIGRLVICLQAALMFTIPSDCLPPKYTRAFKFTRTIACAMPITVIILMITYGSISSAWVQVSILWTFQCLVSLTLSQNLLDATLALEGGYERACRNTSVLDVILFCVGLVGAFINIALTALFGDGRTGITWDLFVGKASVERLRGLLIINQILLSFTWIMPCILYIRAAFSCAKRIRSLLLEKDELDAHLDIVVSNELGVNMRAGEQVPMVMLKDGKKPGELKPDSRKRQGRGAPIAGDTRDVCAGSMILAARKEIGLAQRGLGFWPHLAGILGVVCAGMNLITSRSVLFNECSQHFQDADIFACVFWLTLSMLYLALLVIPCALVNKDYRYLCQAVYLSYMSGELLEDLDVESNGKLQLTWLGFGDDYRVSEMPLWAQQFVWRHVHTDSLVKRRRSSIGALVVNDGDGPTGTIANVPTRQLWGLMAEESVLITLSLGGAGSMNLLGVHVTFALLLQIGSVIGSIYGLSSSFQVC